VSQQHCIHRHVLDVFMWQGPASFRGTVKVAHTRVITMHALCRDNFTCRQQTHGLLLSPTFTRRTKFTSRLHKIFEPVFFHHFTYAWTDGMLSVVLRCAQKLDVDTSLMTHLDRNQALKSCRIYMPQPPHAHCKCIVVRLPDNAVAGDTRAGSVSVAMPSSCPLENGLFADPAARRSLAIDPVSKASMVNFPRLRVRFSGVFTLRASMVSAPLSPSRLSSSSLSLGTGGPLRGVPLYKSTKLYALFSSGLLPPTTSSLRGVTRPSCVRMRELRSVGSSE